MTALTPLIYHEYDDLVKTYPLIQQYEDLTERAMEAFNNRQMEEMKRVGAARVALRYVPAAGFSVAAGKNRLLKLQIELTGRRKNLLKEIHSPQSIEHGVACSLYLDHLQELLKSTSRGPNLAEPLQVNAIDKKTALTATLQEERTYLTSHYSDTLHYEMLTQAAREAHVLGRWNVEEVRKIGAQRATLNYVPPSGFTVASGRTRLEALRTKVEQRQQTHLDALQILENIGYVVACNECLDEVKDLLRKQTTLPPVSTVSQIIIYLMCLLFFLNLGCHCYSLFRMLLQL